MTQFFAIEKGHVFYIKSKDALLHVQMKSVKKIIINLSWTVLVF
ncbi:MAG: hypothetical protein ACKPKO_02295 [Candidatus Fonsibacter sp.]